MFSRLRLKLTIINASIILLLFLLLIGGVYLFAQLDMNRRAGEMAKRIHADLLAGRIHDLPPHGLRPRPPGGPEPPLPGGPPPEMDFFFVTTAADGTVTFQSTHRPVESDRLAALTQSVLQADRSEGTVAYAQDEYAYIRSPLLEQPGTLILFRDLARDREMLKVILTALTCVGAACLLLSFGASHYMAGRAMIPIQKAWQQQKMFLSDASHELRTPLAVIQTNLDVVRGKPEDTVASQGKWLENIQEESVKMAKLVDSLLFLARSDSEQQLIAKRRTNLSNAIMRAVDPFEVVAAAKGVLLEMDVAANQFGVVDEDRIKQVIGILLDNAIRHTPPGGKVLVAMTQTPDEMAIAVTDTGEGIAAEYLEKIFDRFFQVDKSRGKGGAGLGLAIARWIAEKHGGSLTVASAVGRGSTFTLRIPLITAAG